MRRRGRAGLLAVGMAVAGGVPGAVAAQAPAPALRTDFLVVHVDPATGAVEAHVLDAAGGTAATAHAPGLLVDGAAQTGYAVTGPTRARNAALDVTLEALGPRAVAVTWAARDGATHDFALRLLSDDETAYYGTGERFNALDQRGYALPLVTDDRYGNKGVGSYKPVPFFMSSRGFGVWVDTWAPGHFDLSATERFVSTLRFRETRLRVVFLAGPSFVDILEAYTALSATTCRGSWPAA